MCGLQDILNSLKKLNKEIECVNPLESKPYPNEYS